MHPFSKSMSVSDNSFYCVKCSEELDHEYLTRNYCSLCTRLLDRSEIKFVMPSRLYSSYFFDKLPVSTRLMCTGCYKRVERLDLLKRPLIKIRHIRSKLGLAIARRSGIRAKTS